MADKTALQFTVALADNAALKDMQVMACSGLERMSQPYRWTIELESDKAAAAINLNGLLQQEATLVLTRGGASERVPGVIVAATRPSGGSYRQRYQVTLMPRLALAEHTRRSRVFAKRQQLQPLLQAVLGEHGVSAEFAWEKMTQRAWPAVMQWQESDLAFITRLLENEGAFYWFDFPASGPAKLRIGNARNCHPDASVAATLHPDGGGGEQAGTVVAFAITERVAVQEAAVLEYRPQGGAYARTAAKGAHAHGIGVVTEHDASAPFRAAGSAHGDLAQVRAQAAWCNQALGTGSSDVPALRAGRLLKLAGHPAKGGSSDFLVIEVEHTWTRPGSGETPGYRNRFTAVPADRLPWRPLPTTPRPRIDGLLLGVVVDTVGDHKGDDGDSADFTYRVRMQLEGEAGAPRAMRLAQPYAGKGFGTHFPLPAGAEVLVGHIDGDPDRPVITAALPNHDHPSPVTEANKTQCVIRSAGGNELRFEDKGGSEQVHLNAKKDLEQIVGGNCTAKAKESLLIEAGKDITITVGAASITMEASGKITITGTQVAVEGSATAEVSGAKVALAGKALAEVKATLVKIN